MICVIVSQIHPIIHRARRRARPECARDDDRPIAVDGKDCFRSHSCAFFLIQCTLYGLWHSPTGNLDKLNARRCRPVVQASMKRFGVREEWTIKLYRLIDIARLRVNSAVTVGEELVQTALRMNRGT